MATERPATQVKRILVVEDEPMIRMLLEDMLGELGYSRPKLRASKRRW
jgi:CheY-like chemotaxis protein